MYRNYEEYMRVVLGYKPMIQAQTVNPYINLYEDAKFNNMHFADEQVRNKQNENNNIIEKKNMKEKTVNNIRNNNDINDKNYFENISNYKSSNTGNSYQNLNRSAYQNSRKNQYQDQKQREDKSKQAMSYKNFLKF